MFPFLIDDNTGARLYESADIVRYLCATYGEGATLPPLLLESTLVTGWMPTLLRAGRGMTRFDRAAPPPPPATRADGLLELYSYENNQFCRLVREALTELELPYRLISCGKGSVAGRRRLKELAGSTRCPVLVDPRTGARVSESAEILAYLWANYVRPA